MTLSTLLVRQELSTTFQSHTQHSPHGPGGDHHELGHHANPGLAATSNVMLLYALEEHPDSRLLQLESWQHSYRHAFYPGMVEYIVDSTQDIFGSQLPRHLDECSACIRIQNHILTFVRY